MSELHFKIRQIAEAGSKTDFIGLLSTFEGNRDLLFQLDALIEHALSGGREGRTFEFDTPVGRAIAQSIASFPTRFREAGGNFVLNSERHSTDCPEALDELGSSKQLWDALSYTKYFLQMKIFPQRKIAVLMSARNEGIYLHEWVSFYRAIGVDGIFIYTNDNTDASDALLAALAKNKLVYLIRNCVSRECPIQTKVYRHATLLLDELRDFEWVFCLDADEFFVPNFVPANVSKTAESFINRTLSHAGLVSAICLNWKWFVPDNDLTLDGELVTKRFQRYRPDDHVKSLSRLQDVIEFTAHVPKLLPRRVAVNGAGQPVSDLSPRMPPYYHIGQINHYWSKSFPEFVLKKHRGLASKGLAGEQRSYSHYFEWNRNANAAHEPFPETLSQATVDEMSRIALLPGVGEALDSVRRTHHRMLIEAQDELGYEAVYEEEKARFIAGRVR